MPITRRFGFLALALAFLVLACSAGSTSSFDPTGACAVDGRTPGAYPDLEALVPTRYQEVPPETLDSGRNCSAGNLGSLASHGISEVRFAGGTWTFGAERAAVLAVFRATGLTADALATLYADGARVASRTKVLGASAPMIRGAIPGTRALAVSYQRRSYLLRSIGANQSSLTASLAIARLTQRRGRRPRLSRCPKRRRP